MAGPKQLFERSFRKRTTYLLNVRLQDLLYRYKTFYYVSQ